MKDIFEEVCQLVCRIPVDVADAIWVEWYTVANQTENIFDDELYDEGERVLKNLKRMYQSLLNSEAVTTRNDIASLVAANNSFNQDGTFHLCPFGCLVHRSDNVPQKSKRRQLTLGAVALRLRSWIFGGS